MAVDGEFGDEGVDDLEDRLAAAVTVPAALTARRSCKKGWLALFVAFVAVPELQVALFEDALVGYAIAATAVQEEQERVGLPASRFRGT